MEDRRPDSSDAHVAPVVTPPRKSGSSFHRRVRGPLRMILGLVLVTCGVFVLATGQAHAEKDTLKIGLVLQLTGPFSDSGRQMMNGIKTYMSQYGDRVAGT